MSAPDTVGSICIKEQVKGTEYECACQKCDSIKNVRGMSFDNGPMYDEYTLERLNG